MAFPNPTGQTPTGQEQDSRALPAAPQHSPMLDEDADWDRFGAEDPEAIYSAPGEAAEPSRDQFAQDEGLQAPTSLDEVDLASMTVEDRVAAVNGFLGVELPEDKALAIADGYMRNYDYTQKNQTLADNQRMVQSLLQQAGYAPPDSLKQLNPFLQQQIGPVPPAPLAPAAPLPPQPAQSTVPGPPAGKVQPYDSDGFLKWWNENMDRPATQGDLDRWRHEVTFGQFQRQQEQQQWQSTVTAAIDELNELGNEFKHLQEPGVRDAVEQIAYQRLMTGHAYPGMMREIYFGRFGQEAFKRQQLETAPQRPRKQAPPVPPGGPGGAPPAPPQHDLRSAEGILEKQLNDQSLLEQLSSTLESDDPEGIYHEAAARLRR